MEKLEVRDIRKSYGTLEVLKGISLAIEPGQITTITGASGAGKTTLLQIMGTLDTPDSGQVLYDGVDVTTFKDKKLSHFRGSHIGFIFQTHQLLPEFTAQENVMLPALLAGTKRTAASRRAAELLDLLGLSERLRHKPSALSGGECQRVAVARALVNAPDIVFADEPTGSLDTHNRDEISALFLQLRDTLGQTFVIVTHDPTLATLGDRTLPMRDGLLVPPEAQPSEAPTV